MVVFTKLTSSGLTILDANSITVNKSTSANNSSSNFSANIDNFYGRNKGKFTVGNVINIYADIGSNPPTTRIFSGILEDIKFDGKPNSDTVAINGRDFSARMMDRTVEPEVYTGLGAGSIVKDIINKYTDDITTTNVNSPAGSVARITFTNISVYDAVKQLSELSGYVFYVDADKDLHFEEKSSVSSNLTFNSGNTIAANFDERRDTVFNEVWVYGDRYLDGHQEDFTAGSPLGGSVFTLLYKPHNTLVHVAGSIQVGGILEMSTVPPSGTNYLVSYNDKSITFVSGTDLGYSSIPASGDAVVIGYDRALPIVKQGIDNPSVAAYGKRVKTIIDKNIKDPETAQDIVRTQLLETAVPKKEGNISIQGVLAVTPTQTAVVDFPNEGVNNKTYDILSASYNFSPNNLLSEKVLKIKVNKKLHDMTDTIKDILNELKKIQADEVDTADIITRGQFVTGSLGIRSSGCIVKVRSIAGDGLVWGNQTFGIWDSYKWKDPATTAMIYNDVNHGIYNTSLYGGSGLGEFVLGDNQFGKLGTSQLGQTSQQYTTIWSGCYF